MHELFKMKQAIKLEKNKGYHSRVSFISYLRVTYSLVSDESFLLNALYHECVCVYLSLPKRGPPGRGLMSFSAGGKF